MGAVGYYRQAPRWLRNIVPIIALYFSYIIFSKLGYFLVIPDSVVSVMWPSAGIALGFVYVLGNRVAIGVFLASFTITFSVYTAPGSPELVIATLLSTGATLHAIIGAALIKKFSKTKLHLGSLKSVIIFLVLGGPLACIITALIGGFTFTYLSDVPDEQFWGLVQTWWAGDVFGVIVFAPLTAIVVSQIHRSRTFEMSTLLAIILPMAVSISIFAFLFNSVKNELLKHAYDGYYNEVNGLVNQFTEVLSIDITTVNATSSYLAASTNVTASEFKTFTKPLLNNSAGLYGMSWLPKVTDQTREQFVKSIQNQGYSDFEIRSRNSAGELENSMKREAYYPLAYTEPYEQNKRAHGFDVYGQDGVSGYLRRVILDDARDMGEARATSRFPIVQKQDEYGFIIYHPVYRDLNSGAGQEHIGYINGIFVFPKLVRKLVNQASLLSSEFFLTEIQANLKPILLFDTRTPDNKEGPAKSYELSTAIHTEHEFDVAGKRWKITFIKNQTLLTGELVKFLWALAGGGALFNTLVLTILIMITSQNIFVQKLVGQRTRELKRANEELEEFAYRTSHDLRSPIVSSVALLGVADEAIRDGNTEVASKSISHAKKSLGKLEALISDILTLTQIGSTNEQDVFLEIQDVIDEALGKLDHADGFEKLTIEQDIRFKGRVSTKPTRLKLILENLISNAAKYYDPNEETPTLKISCYAAGEHLHLDFTDNGLGISEDYRHQVFDMFKRFHPKVAAGSGLGLYLVKTSARMLDGDISYQPLEKGSLFQLSIPIKQMKVDY